MATNIPEEQLRFAQLAVSQGWVRPEQVSAARELFERYAERGAELPSLPRILINKGFLGRRQGEILLRHIYSGDPLPQAAAIPAPPAPQVPAEIKKKLEAEAQSQARPTVPAGPPLKPIAQRKTDSLQLPVPATRTANIAPGTPIRPAAAAVNAIPPARPVPPAAVAAPLRPSPPPSAPPPVRPPVAPGRAVPSVEAYDPLDTDSAILEGLGALVLSKELQDIKSYRIESVVGEGAMGTVYRAMQVSMERVVALKVLPPNRTRDPIFVEEFLAEARNAGRLNHPNLIRVHEVGKSGSLFYYSMEYIEGQRLDEMIDECDEGRLDVKQALLIFSQVASALEYGHKSGIIHRELRPNSVMVTPDGLAKLADLGLVKDEETRFLVGENAYYVAPEQARGEPADTRSDIYSLGCCLFQCVTGERPFDEPGTTPQEVLVKRLNAPPPSPYQFNANLPQELSRAIMKMMQRDPAQRYQTPGEVFEALKKVNLTPRVPTPPRSTPMRRKFRR